jgi:hypothetical protein
MIVNENKPITAMQGTMSTLVPIDFDFPCALNMTIVPESDGFTFDPYHIDVVVGDVKAEFRISVPETALT